MQQDWQLVGSLLLLVLRQDWPISSVVGFCVSPVLSFRVLSLSVKQLAFELIGRCILTISLTQANTTSQMRHLVVFFLLLVVVNFMIALSYTVLLRSYPNCNVQYLRMSQPNTLESCAFQIVPLERHFCLEHKVELV
jgi:hypothetical protein